MTDSQLIEKYLSGDISSFNTLVWRWEKKIYNFSYRFLGDAETSKDITQKVFIRLYKNLDKLKDRSKFSSWIYQITANLCRDELKSSKRKRALSIESINETHKNLVEDENFQPDEEVNQMQLRSLIKDALQSIPEEQRIVIIMKEYQGLKFVEIAEALGEPLNTVKSRMYYGLNALRKVFKRWNINQEALQYEM
ncbi:sigma-70 family RNA polymerase sigma factor [candidate division KSB1 bacterium]|nr:sigma-70 family RNA polymerase sigma factor [candidate division KSB1 bacterium]